MDQARLVIAAEALARTSRLAEDEQVAELRHEGFAEGEAHRLVAFLPMAFSRPILEELGVTQFDTLVRAKDADGKEVEAVLVRQPEYVAALKLARAHRKRAVMPLQVYKLIAGSSAELNAASNALNLGEDIAGAAVSTMLVGTGIADYLIR